MHICVTPSRLRYGMACLVARHTHLGVSTVVGRHASPYHRKNHDFNLTIIKIHVISHPSAGTTALCLVFPMQLIYYFLHIAV
jgi:hypothetical protein